MKDVNYTQMESKKDCDRYMKKTYWKMIGLDFLIGMAIGAIYNLGHRAGQAFHIRETWDENNDD